MINMRFNGFIFALVLAIIAAYFFPEGSTILPLETITAIGVGLIFFFYGLKLSPSEFRSGISNYKLHLLVQLATFLIFPVLVLLFYPFANAGGIYMYWKAFFFLAVVPSTVSSSVILVALAKGNVPAAIFNASLSGIIGVAVTPFWLSFFIGETVSPGFGEILWKLICQIISPLAAGFLLQRFFEKWVNKYRKPMQIFDKTVIVLIVYASFSASFSAKVFSSLTFGYLLLLVLAVLALFLIVYFGIGLLSKKMGFSRNDQITAKYCGSQKSLVHGSVMAKIIFGNSPAIGIFLLPLMVYHFVQILLISWFAEKVGGQR
ncbi:MAG TPA: bile acid:sodium symporter family protein [Flavobacteriaceae bacterium]|nr:bile acid:sodium symporter family protein [Flavobacteriaceae bacterium]